VGQGSSSIGQGRHPAADEEEALRTGLSLGMTLIDTSGDYGEGRSEDLIKRVIARLLGDPILGRFAAAHACSAAAVALAWTIRSGNAIVIPESGFVAHVKENAVALSLALTLSELQTLDTAHPLSGR
jgi:diketogulonate reductase-like aldo/keto reductase